MKLFWIFLFLGISSVAFAATPGEQKEILKKIEPANRLGQPVPQMEPWLGKGKPVLLIPFYARCPMLCPMTLENTVKALKVIRLKPGKDFEVVAFSIDPNENAAQVQKFQEKRGKENLEGWHFLTASEAQIAELTQAIGFRYEFIEERNEFAHPAMLAVVSPRGLLTRQLNQIEVSAKDLQLALSEAADNKIGTFVDKIFFYCFHYDPSQGKYSLAVIRLLQVGGVGMCLALGGFVIRSLRRERKR